MMTWNEIRTNPALFSSPNAFMAPAMQCITENGVQKYVPSPKAVEYAENGDVVLRVHAPTAECVELMDPEMQPGKEPKLIPFAAESDGWWKLTLQMRPSVHVIRYYIDHRPVLYPMAQTYYNGDRMCNYIDVPNPAQDFYLLKDVPHGVVRQEFYRSAEFGWRRCLVYTPPGYDIDPEKRYPALYLQHGAGENEAGWMHVGKMNFIMDNLLAEGKCQPMIVVCNCGFIYGSEDNVTRTFQTNLGPLLRNDCIPFIESHYRVLPGKENRALAGLSMGAFEAAIAVNDDPDLVDYIGLFSGLSLKKLDPSPFFMPGYDPTPRLKDPEAFNASHKLFYLSRGEREGADGLRDEVACLRSCGIKVETYYADYGHEFGLWREAAHDFVPRLFG